MFFIKKKKEGGFINPLYEKVERAMGILLFIIIAIVFVVLIVMCIKDILFPEVI